jgi:hypothetical protein
VNRRQWKKACKRAAAELNRRWPGVYEFHPAEGDETMYRERGYYQPYASALDRRYPTAVRGMPIVWRGGMTDCGPEYDCYSATSILREAIGNERWSARMEAKWAAEAAQESP